MPYTRDVYTSDPLLTDTRGNWWTGGSEALYGRQHTFLLRQAILFLQQHTGLITRVQIDKGSYPLKLVKLRRHFFLIKADVIL